MSAYDPSHLPPPRDFGSTGMRDFTVEVSLSYRRVLTVPAECSQQAEQEALKRLEELAPVIFEDAQVVVDVENE